MKGVHYVEHIKENLILSFSKPAVTPHSLLFVALRFDSYTYYMTARYYATYLNSQATFAL